jgi:hypothetical protein
VVVAAAVMRVFLNVYDAEVARGALQAAGIDAWVRSDDAGGVHPGMWTARGVQLFVKEEDVARADAVLNSFSGPWEVDRSE